MTSSLSTFLSKPKMKIENFHDKTALKKYFKYKTTKKSIEYIIHQKLIKKYVNMPKLYNLNIIDNIIYNDKTHIVSLFKDHLISDDKGDFLKRYYNKQEIDLRLPKFYEFYELYSKIFPNYTCIEEGKYFYRNIQQKQKMINMIEKLEMEKKLKNNNFFDNNNITDNNTTDDESKDDSCEKVLNKVGIFIRPKVKEFLEEISKYFLIGVFTAAIPEYADAAINYLDPEEKYIKFKLYRNDCINIGDLVRVKDLNIFGEENLDKIVLLDNNIYSFSNQLSNGILINSFFDDENDDELSNVRKYLIEYIFPCDDVRKVNEQFFGFETILNNFVN